ncbi:MAG: S41 family peptidase [Oscillospiraceae bacterium]|nr:S41 family peptidase [Oscillospiraceae bacterium]
MNKKISLGATITLMIMAAAVTFSITMIYYMDVFNGKVYNLKERETMYSKLSELDRIIRANYINDIDEDALNEALADGYVIGSGDKYARYFTPEEYEAYMIDLEGRVVGIGVSAEMDPSGYILIREVYEESPAAIVGLQAGDLIIKVDELDVNTETYEQASQAIRGEEGSKVNITYRRESEDTTIEVTRRKVDVPTVFSRMIDGNVGYVQVTEFNDSTSTQFSNQVDALISQGAQALIFDMRNNGGGTLTSVTKMLDKLLPEGDIVSAVYKDGTVDVLAKSDENEINLPMVVLTNNRTASAAELFTQALRDYNKAKSVGTITYGKGTMQSVKKLNDGSAVNVTVARYLPPSGISYDGEGIKPDYEVELTADMQANLGNLDETTDPQLRKALEVVTSSLRGEGVEPPSSSLPTPQESESSEAEESSEASWENSDEEENEGEDSAA